MLDAVFVTLSILFFAAGAACVALCDHLAKVNRDR